jgi:histidinol phosphatase-like enzyme (inositol monophosphatase family)
MPVGASSDWTEAAAFAAALADAAAPVALRYFRQPLAIEDKPDSSPVTIADRTVERLLRGMIRERFPADGVLGEEHGGEALDSERVWVLDPIDGTKSFISGMPTFGLLVALLDRGRPVLGLVDHPALKERWLGTAGAPTLWNGRPCRARDCRHLAAAMLYATSPDIFAGADREPFERVSRSARMRRFGGDCFAYALLAGGCIDAVVEAGLQPYDYLPLVPVIEGAGGVITDWSGERLGLGSDGRVAAAATRELHAEIVDRLNS